MASYKVRSIPELEDKDLFSEHPKLLSDLLSLRGVLSAEAARDFMAPSFEKYNHDPFQLPDMEKGVERILLAIERGEKICIWSDYDCDGIPGGALLHDFFKLIQYENFVNYIPHRHLEGYGLNEKGIEKLAEDGVHLILTVDSGITDKVPVSRANLLGIDVIVTDHHLPLRKKNERGEESDDLPEGVAIINPKRESSTYAFDGLSGTGVAWKLIQAVLSKNRFGVAEGQEKWLLDLVGIATVADMMPLIDENRMLVHFGLVVLRKTKRPGLRKLYAITRLKANSITEEDIGFTIAPRINAASRMDMPRDAFELLVAKTEDDAHALARHLDKINNQRKGVVAATVKEAKKRLSEEGLPEGPIVMGNPSWRPGLLGLVANSLAETYNKPVFLWGREGGETIKGSCRSDGVMSVVELMAEAKTAFLDFGGHKFSGGFSVNEEDIHGLRDSLTASYAKLKMQQKEEEPTMLDRELALEEVTMALSVLSKLAPFGIGNEKPLFLIKGALLTSVKFFGKEGNHLDFLFTDANHRKVGGIAFFSAPEDFTTHPKEGLRHDLVAHVERDWKGSPRLRVVDIL